MRAELRQLFEAVNAAARVRDRAALERLYAPEYRWVHASGYVDDRTVALDDTLETEPPPELRLTLLDPPNELVTSGDIAVLRSPAGPLVSTAVYVRRDGRWQFLQLQGTTMRPAVRGVTLSEAALDPFTGSYARAAGTDAVVARGDRGLSIRIPGIPRRWLTPTSDSTFVDKLGSEYTFHRDAGGGVTGYTVRLPGGSTATGRRVP